MHIKNFVVFVTLSIEYSNPIEINDVKDDKENFSSTMALITCLYVVISIFHWPATPAYFEGIQQNKNIHMIKPHLVVGHKSNAFESLLHFDFLYIIIDVPILSTKLLFSYDAISMIRHPTLWCTFLRLVLDIVK